MCNIHFYYSGNTIYCLMYSGNATHDHFYKYPNALMRIYGFTSRLHHGKRSCYNHDALSH